MTTLTAACIQMRSGTEVAPNVAAASELIHEAAGQGAKFIATPEMTNLLDIRPGMARPKIVQETDDTSLPAFRALAEELGVTLLIGSIAVALPDEERFANRSFMIGPDGGVIARYDKIHMFDVEVGDGQSYRESRAYRPGTEAVLATAPFGKIGMTICYDVRFPALHRALAVAGADLISVPAAFTVPTGEAHWEVLLRARAIETGCYVIAAAQAGRHQNGRTTYGHSMIVDPWGRVVGALGGEGAGVLVADIDPDAVAEARGRVPALANARQFSLSVNPTGAL